MPPNDYVALVSPCYHSGSQGAQPAIDEERDGGMHERANSGTSMEDGHDDQLCFFPGGSDFF